MNKLSSLPDWFPWSAEIIQLSGARIHISTSEDELDLVATLQPHPKDAALFCLRLRNRVITLFIPARYVRLIRRTGGPRSCFVLDLRSRDERASPRPALGA